jgi:hypothetical protein
LAAAIRAARFGDLKVRAGIVDTSITGIATRIHGGDDVPYQIRIRRGERIRSLGGQARVRHIVESRVRRGIGLCLGRGIGDLGPLRLGDFCFGRFFRLGLGVLGSEVTGICEDSSIGKVLAGRKNIVAQEVFAPRGRKVGTAVARAGIAGLEVIFAVGAAGKRDGKKQNRQPVYGAHG